MPVTKTAKRALRSSKRKESVNKQTESLLDMAVRKAKRSKKEADVSLVFSLVDRAAKRKMIHKGKADRMKSRITKQVAK